MVTGKTGTCGVGMLCLCMVEACVLTVSYCLLFRSSFLLPPFSLPFPLFLCAGGVMAGDKAHHQTACESARHLSQREEGKEGLMFALTCAGISLESHMSSPPFLVLRPTFSPRSRYVLAPHHSHTRLRHSRVGGNPHPPSFPSPSRSSPFSNVIPTPVYVIPAPTPVIPAQAGIHAPITTHPCLSA